MRFGRPRIAILIYIANDLLPRNFCAPAVVPPGSGGRADGGGRRVKQWTLGGRGGGVLAGGRWCGGVASWLEGGGDGARRARLRACFAFLCCGGGGAYKQTSRG